MMLERKSSSQPFSTRELILGAAVIALLAFSFYREFSLEENRPGRRMVEGQFTDKTRTDFFSGIVGLPVDVLVVIFSYTGGENAYGVGFDAWFEATWRRGNAVYRVGYIMGMLILAVGAGPIGSLFAYLKHFGSRSDD